MMRLIVPLTFTSTWSPTFGRSPPTMRVSSFTGSSSPCWMGSSWSSSGMGTDSSAIGLLRRRRGSWWCRHLERKAVLNRIWVMRPEYVVDAFLGHRRWDEGAQIGYLSSVKGFACQVEEPLEHLSRVRRRDLWHRRAFAGRNGCYPVALIRLGRLGHALWGDDRVLRSTRGALRRRVGRCICFSLVRFLFCWHGFGFGMCLLFGASPPALSQAGGCSPFHVNYPLY